MTTPYRELITQATERELDGLFAILVEGWEVPVIGAEYGYGPWASGHSHRVPFYVATRRDLFDTAALGAGVWTAYLLHLHERAGIEVTFESDTIRPFAPPRVPDYLQRLFMAAPLLRAQALMLALAETVDQYRERAAAFERFRLQNESPQPTQPSLDLGDCEGG